MIMKKTPEIRFPNYTEPWEQRKLVELYESACSGGTPTSSVEGYYDGNIPFLGISDIDGRIIKDTKKHISEEGLNNSSAVMIPQGTISLAMYASVGKVGITGIPMATSQAFYNMTFSSIPTRDYVYTVLEKMEYFSEWEPMISTGTQRNLNADKVKNLVIRVPSEEERKQIGLFFQNLDNTINLHQREIEQLRVLKRGLLQKMFPKEGQLTPEIRFPGFTEAWKQRKLGELYIERNERGNENLQILSVSIHTGVSDGALDEETLGKFVKRSEDKTTYKHVYAGDLIFNMMRAWQGAIGVAKSEGMISPAYISAIPNDEVYPLFMDYALRRDSAISEINNLSYGVTDFRKRLYWDSFVKVGCMIPSVDEQRKIYVFFKNLDNLIALHQRKSDKLNNLKRGLLQKMFV